MDKNIGKVIDIKEYLEGKKEKKEQGLSPYKAKYNFLQDEERIKTFNLFMKVLATMKKESYK